MNKRQEKKSNSQQLNDSEDVQANINYKMASQETAFYKKRRE